MADKTFDQYLAIRVLILEDNQDDAGLVIKAMDKLGKSIQYRIVDDEGGFTSEIRTFIPHLILADYALPSFNGFEALSIAQQECPEVPFIFVTGTVGEEIAAETVLNGASGLVLKSNLQKLPEAINKAFDEKGIWYSNRARFANRRITSRIEANIKTLERIQNFLNRKHSVLDPDMQAEVKAAIDDLRNFRENLKGNDEQE